MTAPPDPSRRGIARWLPQSLFGRLLAVLTGGLLVAQLLSAAINLAERENLLATSGGMQRAQRIADVVRLLDSLSPEEGERVAAVLNVPPLVVTLHDAPDALPAQPMAPGGPPALIFRAMLRAMLGDDRAMQVQTLPFDELRPGPGRGPGLGRRHGAGMMGGGPEMMVEGFHGAPEWAGAAAMLRTTVQLRDGRWARFDVAAPGATAPPWRLAAALAVLLAAVLVLSYVAVRWITRPLHVLAEAADELGRDLHRAPLPETGPLEIRQAARAFNSMQRRLARFIEDRTRVLAAMSHDLKTPLTRMRLRAELLDDEDLRARFESDLAEMQAMVQSTLDFMRGLGGEAAQSVDFNALLQALQADQQAMGRDVQLEGRATMPYQGVASLLRRCLNNLVDNAVAYGGKAMLRVEDGPDGITVRVLDTGPGLADSELEQVFEPFYRLEASRNRATGGTGLGLTIARNIAQSHGGDIRLANRPEGGLEAVLFLPRTPSRR